MITAQVPTKVFKTIEAGENEIRVYRDSYKGREYLSVRKFYKDGQGQWQPGKGVTFQYENIDEIIEGLQEMQAFLEEETQYQPEEVPNGPIPLQ